MSSCISHKKYNVGTLMDGNSKESTQWHWVQLGESRAGGTENVEHYLLVIDRFL